MSIVLLSKYSGAGNDFVLIDDRTLFFPVQDQKRIQDLCQGVDGLILLQCQHADSSGIDPTADFRMRIFNCDGNEASMCGNGVCCLMRFLIDLGMEKKGYKIAVGCETIEADFVGDRIRIQMGEPKELQLGGAVHRVDTGVPHAVVFVENVEKVDVASRGKKLREELGANVNFVEILQEKVLFVRTYERGVERETRSCGTGAMAVGVIAAQLYGWKGSIRMVFQGGEIEIDPKKRMMIGSAVPFF